MSNGIPMKTIALIGLGYVGLNLAVAFNKTHVVYGYDISKDRISELKRNIDRNMSFGEDELAHSTIQYTNNIEDIKDANFYIVTVSTPALFEQPNLDSLTEATKALARILKNGDIIVFESTSYPGTTEEICLPLLEEISHLKSGVDFDIGYSPERISPADEVHTLKTVPKIISAQNEKTLKIIEAVYSSYCDTVYAVSDIKTAEAIKILENTQRDINIAFMNEFSQIMHALNLNVHEIIEAAKTKWTFTPIKPGLVGGHCIAVDPYYLAFKAKRLGVSPDLILTARKINDNITQFLVRELIKVLIRNNVDINTSIIGIFGITYKENTPDIRNSLSLKLIKELVNVGFKCIVHDPMANKKIVKDKYKIELKEFDDMKELSAVILTVGHDYYREIGMEKFLDQFLDKKIIMDIPNLFIEQFRDVQQLDYWSL